MTPRLRAGRGEGRPSLVAALALLTVCLVGCGRPEPQTQGGAAQVRQLTEAQYRNTIEDIFGASITVVGRFDSPKRDYGLLAVGASSADITPSALERYDALARQIAAQVIDTSRRDTLINCRPASATTPDDACAGQFLGRVGRLLYRRPLSADEIQNHVAVARRAAESRGDFYAGVGFALSGLLVSPAFLFVADTTEPDPAQAGAIRLTGFAKAARLSFRLWNSSPDDALLAAAERGELHSDAGLARQVDRLLASPSVEAGVRGFFSDMLGFDGFDELAKDSVIYPAFSTAMVADMREQALRTIVDLLLTRRADYRDLFTTRDTFMNRQLAVVYHVPTDTTASWAPYTFPADDPRAGVQAQLSFLALHSHPGKSSPTLRGKAVRELLLCQKVPPPPADVDFNLFNDPNSTEKTVRERLTAHRDNPTCAGCHRNMDPIGLTMENFDGLGQYRTVENGAPIDASGDLDQVAFAGPAGLGRVLHDNPAASSCLVNRLYAYAVARPPAGGEREWLSYQEKRFSDNGYRLPDLLRSIATSRAFYAIAREPATSAAGTTGPAGERSL